MKAHGAEVDADDTNDADLFVWKSASYVEKYLGLVHADKSF